MLFSIIIPVYNRPDYLIQAIESCLVQTFEDFEIIVIDDGSPLDIHSSLERYLEKIRLVRIENSGAGVARNYGVELSKGRFIVFLDSDDRLFPHSLDVYRLALQRNPETVLMLGLRKRFNENLDYVDYSMPNEYSYRVFKSYFEKDENPEFGASNIVIKKELFKSIGGFKRRTKNTSHAEDHDLLLKAGTAQGFLAINAPATVLYRIHNDNSINEYGKAVAGITELFFSESARQYPGGDRLKFKRLAIIGTPAFHWVIKLFKTGHYRLALNLMRVSFKAIVAFLIYNIPQKLKAKSYVRRSI